MALTVKEYASVEGGACFWHMVNLLWIVLFHAIAQRAPRPRCRTRS
jgi:heme/copper-type cytochrome/quinol oxidase subunit 3